MEDFFKSERGNHRADVKAIMDSWIDIPKGSRILELGGRNEPLSEWLQQRGYDVTVIDLEGSETDGYLKVRSHKWIVGDFFTEWKNLGRFDAVISCSAIEHFGMPWSPEERTKVKIVFDNFDDYSAIRYVDKMLKLHGLFYITVPVIKKYGVVADDWRCYDMVALKERIIQWFVVQKTIYFKTDLTKGSEYLSVKEAFNTEEFERNGNTCMLRLMKA